MNTLRTWAEAAMSYAVSLMVMLFNFTGEHLNGIMAVGGFVLLIARLYTDVGAAIDRWKAKRNERSD